MNDKIVKDWLSGKSGNPGGSSKIDYYALEKSKYSLKLNKDLSRFTGPDSPYNRSYTESVDLDLLLDCLTQMDTTHDPLPVHLSLILNDEIGLLKSNRPGNILRHGKNPKLHPDEALMQRFVIDYVEGVKARGFDDNPLKTIKEEFAIGKSTYYDWKKNYKYPINLSSEAISDEQAIEHLRWIWGKLMSHYKPPK